MNATYRIAKRTRLTWLFLACLGIAMALVPGQVSHAQVTTGTISGTVTDETTGLPLPNVFVHILSSGVIHGCSNSQGLYAMSGLTPGEYFVEAIPGTDFCGPNTTRDYASEWWRESIGLGSASAVILSPESPDVAGIDFTLGRGGSISGTVRDLSGNPLPSVYLEASGVEVSAGQGACSDSQGKYEFSGLPIDYSYRVSAGYTFCGGPSLVIEYWSEARSAEAATPVALSTSASHVDGIDFTLEPAGTISGVIRTSTGEPVIGHPVGVLLGQGGPGTCTDPSTGSYSFTNLPFGDYLVSGGYDFLCGPDGFAVEWWPEATRPEDALPVTVSPDAPAAVGIDLRLDPGGSISGTVRDSASQPITGMPMCVLLGTSGPGFETDPATGTYSIPDLPLGSYLVSAGHDFCGPSPYAIEWWQESASESGAALVLLTLESPDVTGIEFTLDLAGPPLAVVEQITFNLRNPILANLDIRRAIAHAIDRRRLLDEAWLPAGEYGTMLHSYVIPGHWAQAAPSEVNLYPFSPETARALLEGQGWVDIDGDGIREKDGIPLSLRLATTDSAPRVAAASAVQVDLRAVGVEVQIEALPRGIIFTESGRLFSGDFDLAMFAWACEQSGDEVCLMPELFHRDDPQNFAAYNSPEADVELELAQQATTREAKLPHLVRHQALITQDLPMFPMFTRQEVPTETTPVGEGVVVTVEGVATITFTEVSITGVTTIFPIPGSPTGVPADFQLLGSFFEVASTATFDQAQVCLPYDDTGLTAEDEQRVRLYHEEAGQLVDVTDVGYPNTTDDVVCGTVTSFSPFGVLLTPYSWTGVLPPINSDGSSVFRRGKTIPVKFKLTGWSAGITDLTARLYVTKISNGVLGPEMEAISTSKAMSGNLFRYDRKNDQFIFNLSIKSLTKGTYQLRIDLGDGTLNIFNISLK